MVKSNPKYKDKCRLPGDKLIIDGVKYTMENVGDLPVELAAYQVVEKSNDTTLVFHGELSPYINFHPSPFITDGIHFPSAEHYIQYHKALLFGDSVTVNNILKSGTPLEAKKLSYNISDFTRSKWINEGYDICSRGSREKFIQNRPLFQMLKGTGSKTLAEASKDKLWGTGIPLHDRDDLITSKWENPRWLSTILTNIHTRQIKLMLFIANITCWDNNPDLQF